MLTSVGSSSADVSIDGGEVHNMWNPFTAESRNRTRYRVHVDDPKAWYRIAEYVMEHVGENPALRRKDGLVVVCIGTDRSTGDSLGPLTGTLITQIAGSDMEVYGTLNEPVHASNLEETLSALQEVQRTALVIAVDACLGKSENVGYINVNLGPLKPGTGVNKVLPEVGDINITGVVNVGGYMEYLVLQNTRLNLVMKMAMTISRGIHYAASVYHSMGGHSQFLTERCTEWAERESAVTDQP